MEDATERVRVDAADAPAGRLEEAVHLLEKRYVHVAQALEALRVEMSKLSLHHEVLQSLMLMEQNGTPATNGARLPLQAAPSSLDLRSNQVSLVGPSQPQQLSNTAATAARRKEQQQPTRSQVQSAAAPPRSRGGYQSSAQSQFSRANRGSWVGRPSR